MLVNTKKDTNFSTPNRLYSYSKLFNNISEVTKQFINIKNGGANCVKKFIFLRSAYVRLPIYGDTLLMGGSAGTGSFLASFWIFIFSLLLKPYISGCLLYHGFISFTELSIDFISDYNNILWHFYNQGQISKVLVLS